MAANKVPWSATHNAWIYSIMESNSPITSVIRDHFQVHSAEEMAAMKPGAMSFSVERLPYEYFAFGDYIQMSTMEALRVMKEDVYFEYALLATRKGWYLKEYMDELILIVHQSGIQKYWLMVTTYKQLDPSVQKSISLSNTRHGGDARSLDFDKVEGIFCLLGFGLAVALAIFVWEVVIGKCCKQKM